MAERWSDLHRRLHQQLLQQQDLLPDGEPLLLAVSGGQDYMALVGQRPTTATQLLGTRQCHHTRAACLRLVSRHRPVEPCGERAPAPRTARAHSAWHPSAARMSVR